MRTAWFKFYPDDWLAGTMELTLEEEAAYLRVCALIYSKDAPIPDNDRWLAGMCRVSLRKWRQIKERLINTGKIIARDGTISNSRAEKELRKRAERSAKAKDSAHERWRKTDGHDREAIEKHRVEPCDRIESVDANTVPYQKPESRNQITPPKSPSRAVIVEEFEEWWELVPAKKSKGRARSAYVKARNKVGAKTLTDGIKAYSIQVRSIDPQFVKHPATWLNGECWADELNQVRQTDAAVTTTAGWTERVTGWWNGGLRDGPWPQAAWGLRPSEVGTAAPYSVVLAVTGVSLSALQTTPVHQAQSSGGNAYRQEGTCVGKPIQPRKERL